jgi:uncharacterized membrane protein YbhN (UPF0104 family)
LVGVPVLGCIGWRLGAGPFLDGVRAVNVYSILLAIAITSAITVCSAWRWQVVARGLGVGLRLRTAVAAYYRSQFLNTALPGGILGDVHRGIDHGRAARDVGRGLRAVVWERLAGQAVQLVVAMLVLAVLPSPVRPALPVLVACAAGFVLLAMVLVRSVVLAAASRFARAWRTASRDLKDAVLAHRAWPAITVSSMLVVAGHVGVFLIAARAAGVDAGLRVLLPLAVLALVAAALPTNIGGWGPREGVAAWAFASAGVGADRGIATATAFGILVLLASLPGAVILVAGALGRPVASPREEGLLVGADIG